MALNTFKCKYPTSLHFKGLTVTYPTTLMASAENLSV